MAKVLMNKNDKFLVKDTSKDYHTKYGFFKKEDLKKNNSTINTNTNKKFSIFNPYFIDFYRKIKRNAQILILVFVKMFSMNHIKLLNQNNVLLK